MSLPPSKRSRSSDSLGRRLSQSGDGTETTVSRDKKYSAYRDVNYPVVLETKGSFMRPYPGVLKLISNELYLDVSSTINNLKEQNARLVDEVSRWKHTFQDEFLAQLHVE